MSITSRITALEQVIDPTDRKVNHAHVVEELVRNPDPSRAAEAWTYIDALAAQREAEADPTNTPDQGVEGLLRETYPTRPSLTPQRRKENDNEPPEHPDRLA